MKIVVIKEPSLLREGMVHVLKENFLDDELFVYGANDYSIFCDEADLADLLILDAAVQIEMDTLIDLYVKKKKKVIIWASTADTELLIHLFKLNLQGYLFEAMGKEDLLAALKVVLNGKQYIHPELIPILFEDYLRINNKTPERPAGMFSIREWQVLELLTQGCKNSEIAKSLLITEKTVKNHISMILKKLNVPDRTNAVLKSLKNEWFYL